MTLNTIKALLILNAKKATGVKNPKAKGWTDAARLKAAATRKAKKKAKPTEPPTNPGMPTPKHLKEADKINNVFGRYLKSLDKLGSTHSTTVALKSDYQRKRDAFKAATGHEIKLSKYNRPTFLNAPVKTGGEENLEKRAKEDEKFIRDSGGKSWI